MMMMMTDSRMMKHDELSRMTRRVGGGSDPQLQRLPTSELLRRRSATEPES